MKFINSSLDDELFPILTTPRLKLRQLSVSDGAGLFILCSSADVNQYLERQKPASTADSEAFIQRINLGATQHKWIYWAISLANSSSLIGTICLWNFNRRRRSAEIGYELLPDFQGQGLMDEAVKVVLNYGFSVLNLDKILAYTHKDNQRSLNLLSNNQFVGVENNGDATPEMVGFSCCKV